MKINQHQAYAYGPADREWLVRHQYAVMDKHQAHVHLFPTASSKENSRLAHIQKEAYRLIERYIPEAIINGDKTQRLPNNINISIPNLASDVIVLFLDAAGIRVSAKSACTSDDTESSYVLAALNTNEHKERALYGSLRISMGKETTLSDVKKTIQSIRRIIDKHTKIL